MGKVRIGLVGLGFMGTTHFRIYKELPDARVVAIADVDQAKLVGDIRKVVGNIGNGDNSVPLEMSGIKTYNSASDLIDDPNIDIVDICAPTYEHQKIALAALKAGKHVLCEKPVCRNILELEELAKEVKRSDKYFNVELCIRAWPEYRHVRELYLSGSLGKLRSAVFRRLSPNIDGNAWENWFMDDAKSGGALLDLHLHDSDFITHILGCPIDVSSFGVKGVRSTGVDHVMTRFNYGPDSLVIAEGGWSANKNVPFEMSFQLVCEKATVRLGSEGYKIYWEDGKVEAPQVSDQKLPTGWHQELSYFVDCVKDGVRPDKYQSIDDVVASFKTVMAELDSVESGRPVKIKL